MDEDLFGIGAVPHINNLVECLQSVEKPGDFACGGPISLPLPALRIDGVDDVLGLPICGPQARAVIEQCSRAPYGRGEQTIVDTAVRKTWQLDPAKIAILNPEWEQRLGDLVSQVKEELGCASSADVSCELYKLLLYEEGGFFKPHRDTEKADGMFGTLIVQLPSHYEGGQLRVKHAEKEHVYDFSGLKGSTDFHYAALYADCQHELCALTKGYRLCLVYNLIYVGSGHCPAPVDSATLMRRTVDAIKGWAAFPSCYERLIAFPLDHKYCEASLSFSNLKNLDRAKADLLRNATGEVEFDLYLCILRINQKWSALGFDSSDLCPDEMIEQEITAECLVSPRGKKAKSVELDEELIKPDDALEDLLDDDLDDEDVEMTGNEGTTMEKWYSKAALVIWPKQRRMDVFGLDTMASRLTKSIDKNGPLQRDSAKWQKHYEECQELIYEAVSHIPKAETVATLLTSAVALGECSLVSTLLGSASSSTNSPTVPASHHLASARFLDALLLVCSTFGWHSLQPCLKLLVEAGAANDVDSCVQFLFRLVTSQRSLSLELKAMGQELALPICQVLVEEEDLVITRPSTSSYWQSPQPTCRSQVFVRNLLKTLSLLDLATQLERVLQGFSSCPNRYPLEAVLLPAIEEFHQWLGEKSNALLSFAARRINALEASAKAAPKEPSDWSQDISMSCKCEDCTELQSFYRHPMRTSARFKVNVVRRSHLEQQMKVNECDSTHMTEYSGSPKTLVVTKTRKRFQRKKQEQKANLRMLSRLRALHKANSTQPSTNGAEPSAKRSCLVDLTD